MDNVETAYTELDGTVYMTLMHTPTGATVSGEGVAVEQLRNRLAVELKLKLSSVNDRKGD